MTFHDNSLNKSIEPTLNSNDYLGFCIDSDSQVFKVFSKDGLAKPCTLIPSQREALSLIEQSA